MADLLIAHLVGHHHAQGVTLLGRNEGKCQSGVTGGGFHDVPTGLQSSVLFCSGNHGNGNAVLDRIAGVQ